MPVYDEFVQLMEKANPGLAGKLPSGKDTALKTLGVKGLIRSTRQIFVNDPLLADKMLTELEHSKTDVIRCEKISFAQIPHKIVLRSEQTVHQLLRPAPHGYHHPVLPGAAARRRYG